MYKGNKHVACSAFSSADLGIIALIGNGTELKLKLPLRTYFPISFITYFPIALIVFIIRLFKHCLPPSLFASEVLPSSFFSK
jgi:hypothetical protein